jgi:hypothetical protein
MVFYNEIEPFAAEWLRQLIRGGHIADGIVDERSIVDIEPDELRGYTQCHFFAGIGGWSYALRLAGVPDHASVWTGSCPCQPFSSAGKQRAADDERHLWPAFFRLIRECRPGIVFGEQVAGHAGYAWWDAVATDLESEDYAVAAADLGAHSVGAPHIRQRLYWVADAKSQQALGNINRGFFKVIAGNSAVGLLAHANNERRFLSERHTETQPSGPADGQTEQRHDIAGRGTICGVGHAISAGLERHGADKAASGWDGTLGSASETGSVNPWEQIIWLPCSDGKTRPIKSVFQQMADGLPESLGRLRADQVAAIEKEMTDATSQDRARDALLDVWRSLAAQTLQRREAGGLRSVQEAPLLLAFLRQLSDQRWAFAQGLPRPGQETSQDGVRVLWWQVPLAGSPRQRGLEGQRADEPPDAVRVLSSVLARHAQAVWGEAFDANARDAFPLAYGVSARVGRLRGYGNAILPQVAAAFITVFSEQFSETAVRPSMSSAQGIDSNGVADGNRTRDTRSHNSEPNQGNTTA